MSFISVASGDSCYKGYEYYLEKKVISYKEIEKDIYIGIVKGRGDNLYRVKIDINHSRRSICNCPFANGRRVLCKHAIALYFTIFPEEAKKHKEELDRKCEEYEQYQKEIHIKLKKYIDKMNKEQLRKEIWSLLNDCPEWTYDKFVNDHLDDL